jgi:Bacterial Ig-like domain
MEINGLKVVGTGVIVGALMTSAFLGGIATRGKSSANPEPTPTVAAVTKDDTNGNVVLVGDGQDESKPEAEAAATQAPSQPQQPASPAPAPVEPTVTPLEPTPVPASPTPVNEPPYVVAISPEDGDAGISPNADIVVTFSEPMDKASAQAAFNLSTGNCGAFSWSAADTVMTFDPCADWDYGTDVAVDIYDGAADDLDLGMEGDFASSFKVLQQSTLKIYSEDAYDGYVYAPGVFVFGDKSIADGHTFNVGTWTRGFVSFDLSDLPEDLVQIQSAKVNLKQKSHQAGAYGPATGSLLIESVTYGTLTNGDWGMDANSSGCFICLLPILSSDASDGWKSMEMSGWVQADWDHRDERDYNSQFRLRFNNDCGDGACASVSAEFYSGMGAGVVRPYMLVTYTHP